MPTRSSLPPARLMVRDQSRDPGSGEPGWVAPPGAEAAWIACTAPSEVTATTSPSPEVTCSRVDPGAIDGIWMIHSRTNPSLSAVNSSPSVPERQPWAADTRGTHASTAVASRDEIQTRRRIVIRTDSNGMERVPESDAIRHRALQV